MSRLGVDEGADGNVLWRLVVARLSGIEPAGEKGQANII